MRLLVLALAVSAIAFAQTDPNSTGSIEGQIASITGEPLRKASITLMRAGAGGRLVATGSASTGNDGKFAIDGLEPGRYVLTASRTGYLAQGYGATAPEFPQMPTIEVLSGSHLTVSLVLTPQAIIGGRLLDEDGDPVEPVAEVGLYKIGWAGGTKQLVRVARGVMNPDGTYMAGGLAPGRYYVGAALPALLARLDGYVQTFYPHTTDVTSAIPIDIGPGEQIRNLDIRMIKGPRFHIRGRAVGASVGGGANLLLQITPRDLRGMPPGAPANVGPDGAFDLESVSPGAYVIESALSTSVASVPVIVTDHDLDDVRVPIGSGITVSGVVTAPVTLTFLPPDNSRRAITATADADGKFEARELRPERYRFTISGLPPDMYVQSVQAGSLPVANDELDLTNGNDVSLRISLSGHAASAAGVVRNGKGDPAINAPVAIWPASVEGVTRIANTGPDGRFQFTSLPPGDYLACAWEELEDGLALNHDFRSRFDAPAVKFSLDESAHREIEINAITRGVTQVMVSAFY